jgi:uncharacterized membrane protein (DUF485 family)
MSKKTKEDLLNDPDFIHLVSTKNTISWILTALELVLYFGFVALIAFNKPFLAQKLNPDTKTTIGIPIAVATIALSWVLTGIYIFWANSKYDAMVKNLKDKIGA